MHSVPTSVEMGTWAIFLLVDCSVCQLWGSLETCPTDRSRERRWIYINANCAVLTLRCSALICMQTHRKIACANVVLLARWERKHREPSPRLVATRRGRLWLALCCSALYGRDQRGCTDSTQVTNTWPSGAACFPLEQLAWKSRGLEKQSCWFLLEQSSFWCPCWS